ncbi:MAG: TetR family transcriptional regulator [Verrucomicrobiota bacterium]
MLETVQDTRQRLLEVAEQFYAERGFEGTSLRSLTDAAGVNLAAVNYHFGSKRNLMWEMFSARIEPINTQRMFLLDKVLAGPELPTLEGVFDALLVPVFDVAQGPNGANLIFLRMIGRVFSESEEFWHQLHNQFFDVLCRRFLDAIVLAEPKLSPEEVAWRFHFSIATMLGALGTHKSLNRNCASVPTLNGNDMDETCLRLRNFICAGFRGAQLKP